MPDVTLKYALWYLKHGLSVVPVNPPRADEQGKDIKKPAWVWSPFQTKFTTEQELTEWFTAHPDHRLGIITGKLSDVLVVDCDDQAAHDKMEELLAGVKTPLAKSPKGWHYHFKNAEDVRNKQRVQGWEMDVRGEGGFIMAPPSSGLNGKGYRWIEGYEPWKIDRVDIPASLIPLLSIRNSNKNIYNIANGVPEGGNSQINFKQGSRDASLFHIASCLVKGGMPVEEIRQVLEMLALRICDPPFPIEEVEIKIKSALNRSETTERNLTEEVKEWALSTTDHWMSTDVHKDLGLSTRVHKKTVSMILSRLCEQGLIEKHGDKRGSFRTVNRTIQEQCWWKDDGQPLPIKFPLGIDEFAKVYGGNIILLEGQKSQGKSAFALEFCRMNRLLYHQKILYQNVEMADSELLDRFRAYGDVMPMEEWRQYATFIRQTSEWWDKVQPDGLNVIDYLVEYEKPYLLAQYVWNIHQKLKSGIALIVVQRDPFKPYPSGGRAVRDIPRVIISLIKHKVRLEDVKSFHPTAYGNPSGLCRKYKQVNWWNFKPDSDWDQEEEQKYAAFKK